MLRLHTVLRLHTALADFAMRVGPCPQTASGAAPGSIIVGGARRVYGITLAERHRYVRVAAGVAEMLGIALRDGKAVAARTTATPGGAQSLILEGLDVDEVQLYCQSEAKSLELCLDIAPTAAQDAAQWASATVIAKGLQVPIHALDSTLTSQAAEDARAGARLLPGEQFDADGFHAVSKLMNGAAADAQDEPPVCASLMLRDEPGDPFVDVSAWSYALALTIDPQRGDGCLGFGLLDMRRISSRARPTTTGSRATSAGATSRSRSILRDPRGGHFQQLRPGVGPWALGEAADVRAVPWRGVIARGQAAAVVGRHAEWVWLQLAGSRYRQHLWIARDCAPGQRRRSESRGGGGSCHTPAGRRLGSGAPSEPAPPPVPNRRGRGALAF